MKVFFRAVLPLLLLASSTPALAQSDAADPAASVRRERWSMAVLAGGGTGLIDRTNVQFTRGGVRFSRVMTGVLGSGPLRGSFEVGSEFFPVDYVLWGGHGNVYGIGFNPLVMKWNFTAPSRRAVPYFLAQGGVLRTTQKVPPGNTSKVNFISGAGVGVQYFIRPRRSINFDVRATHLSNASIGDHNPGVNASLQFSVGYNWWQH